MKELKKMPLFIGLLLITLWGASKKINIPTKDFLCASSTPEHLVSYADKLSQLSCLTTKNWEAFYEAARPLLPASVSDKELQFVYRFLQGADGAYFDETATPEKRLEILLFFTTLANIR